MGVMGREGRDGLRVEARIVFQKARDAHIGKAQVQPQETFVLRQVVPCRVYRQRGAGTVAGLEMIGPDKAGNGGAERRHRRGI